MMSPTTSLLNKISSLTKRRGFIYQGSELYGGLAGTWDYGPLGVALKNNIKNLWWRMLVTEREDMFGLDAAILMNPNVWKSSGHVDGFSDPLVECSHCHKRFRADLLDDQTICPDCSGTLSAPRQFNMMFRTQIGALEDSASTVYLRPETAQGIFVNFKNIIDSFHPKLPFGVGQIGKAFRNEITPRDFIFRVREFEQMEIEYFIKPENWEGEFEKWRQATWHFLRALGLNDDVVREYDVPVADLAHYSKRTIDFEFNYPFGTKELLGLAYRTDFDLRSHAAGSGADLSYFDEETKERFLPHVIEPSFGLERLVLAVLTQAYSEDELGGEKRVFLRLPAAVAPVRIAVFPLLKNKPELILKARTLYDRLRRAGMAVVFDDNGNIGKRYRRQDEIGTPYCVTIDFETLENDTVTVRQRDSGEQERVALVDLPTCLS